MPWRLIIMIIVVAVFLVFIAFNLENRCDINFFGAVIPQVPIFITIFISFLIGLLSTIPLVVLILRKHKKKHLSDSKPAAPDTVVEQVYAEPPENPSTEEKIKKDAQEAKIRFFNKRRDKK